MSILVIIEQSRKDVHRMSYEALVAGQALGQDYDLPVSALVLGHKTSGIVESIKGIKLNEILVAEDPLLNSYSSDGFSETVKQVIKNESPKFIVAGHTYMVRDFLPRVSAKLNLPFLADNIAYDVDNNDSLILTKQIFAGKLSAEIIPNSDGPFILSFQSAAFHKDDIIKGNGSIIREIPLSLDYTTIRTISEEPFQEVTGDVDLSSADIIVSVGRGIESKENMQIVKDFAKIMGAQLASSRPVVDSGWLEAYHQIGSSGQTVAPKLYFALGISGAIQHVVGMKGSKNIILINKDSEAPLFELANYGVVGDVLEIIPKLTEALRE